MNPDSILPLALLASVLGNLGVGAAMWQAHHRHRTCRDRLKIVRAQRDAAHRFINGTATTGERIGVAARLASENISKAFSDVG